MRITGREKLDDFCRAHADARPWIEGWLANVQRARWTAPQDIKDGYQSASFLANNVVIFNVKGNRYRLEAVVAFNTKVVAARWIGTHAEYTKRLGH